MAGELLLDTGALVSLLDRGQAYHAEFVRFFRNWKGPVVSAEAVLTEATHLLARVPGGPQACCDSFLEDGAVFLPTSRTSLRRCRQLMERYSDLPMDYADATLAALAE
jgi:predicted nucleic acid-binding protein